MDNKGLLEAEAAIVSKLRAKGDVRSTFRNLDLKRNGTISHDELRIGLQKYGVDISSECADALVKKYAHSAGGFSYSEFVNFYDGNLTRHLTAKQSSTHNFLSTHHFSGPALEQAELTAAEEGKGVLRFVRQKLYQHGYSSSRSRHFAELFLKFDTARTGTLSYSEIDYGLTSLGIDLSPKEIVQLLWQVDRDHHGYVTLYDFMALLQRDCNPAATYEAQQPSQPQHDTVMEDSMDEKTTPMEISPPVMPSNLDRVSEGARDAVIVQKIVSHLEADKMQLKEIFNEMDKEGDGTVTPEEFRSGLLKIGIQISEPRVRRLLSKFDLRNDGKLHYYEFVRMVSGTMGDLYDHEQEKGRGNVDHEDNDDYHDTIATISSRIYDKYRQLKKAFSSFDTKGNKQITFAEFLKGLSQVGLNIPEDDARHIFDAFDTTRSGTLRYHEFAKLLAASTT